MTLRVGESGKTFRVATGFDMSANTDISITLTKPDGTSVMKTKSASEISLGTTPITDPDLGALAANTYINYPVETGVLTLAGTWYVQLTYTYTGVTPNDTYISQKTAFTVLS